MRGEHRLQARQLGRRLGIIPACAGSTFCLPSWPPNWLGSSPHARGALTSSFEILPLAWDHPRMRGEHLRLRAGVVHHVGGSSPHARGARDGRGVGLLCLRDHPRMRGEHWGLVAVPSTLQGIIPACAGSTIISSWRVVAMPGSSPHARGAPPGAQWGGTRSQDHPRMRGEHSSADDMERNPCGIIPACAGSTGSAYWYTEGGVGSSPHARGARSKGCLGIRWRWDHPRMRGEHHSSPSTYFSLARIIPACAGSTSAARWSTTVGQGSSPHARGARHSRGNTSAPCRDHPRMRGEHVLAIGEGHEEFGIIPACAGSTRSCLIRSFFPAGSSPHAREARRKART